ncbi:MAG TPA: RHS repeat-associated core domain-containing protein, partial [Pirellulales bacterium]|nr:RHS repeat-associated core domain-containing protein [Pirellulales bacterium]
DVYFYNNDDALKQHVHYVYDVFDNLIERDLDPTGTGSYTQIVHYIWDGGENGPGKGNIVLAFNGSDQLIARYLNGPSTSAYDQYFTDLAEEDVTSTSSPGTVTYPLLDDRASVVDTVDANGNLVNHIVYVATGAVWYESNPAVLHIAGWQGAYTDSTTGMVKFGARWEYMADAFWASPDPIGLLGGTNLSAVVFNDPANLADPSGLYTPRPDHHIVPQAVFNGIGGFSKDVIDVFNNNTFDLLYNHGNDTWDGVTHPSYSGAVREELMRVLGGGTGKQLRAAAKGFSPAQAQAFVDAILAGKCPSGANAKTWDAINKYLVGMAKSDLIAAAARAEGKVENIADLKKLARLADGTGSNTKVLPKDLESAAAKAFYKSWLAPGATGARFRALALKGALVAKIARPLAALIALGKCSSALANGDVAGAAYEAADGIFAAKLAEELATTALAPAGKYFDNALDTGQMNHALRRFNNDAMSPLDRENMRRAIQGPRPYQPPRSPFE